MLTLEARRRFERQVAGGEAREQVGGDRRLPELGQANRAGHPTEYLPRPLTKDATLGERDRAVACGQAPPVGSQHERYVGVTGGTAGRPSRRVSRSWGGVESTRSAPLTTSPISWAAASTVTAS
jgi:hypothetical protein